MRIRHFFNSPRHAYITIYMIIIIINFIAILQCSDKMCLVCRDVALAQVQNGYHLISFVVFISLQLPPSTYIHARMHSHIIIITIIFIYNC